MDRRQAEVAANVDQMQCGRNAVTVAIDGTQEGKIIIICFVLTLFVMRLCVVGR